MLRFASRSTFTNGLEAPSRWLAGSTNYINRFYDFLAFLMFVVEFQQRSNAELIRAAEKNTQWFELILCRIIARPRLQQRSIRRAIP